MGRKNKLFAEDIIIYGENLKELTKKLLGQLSDYSKVAGYKVNIQKSITLPHTSNGQVEFGIKNIIPFISAHPKIKHLGINLTNIYKIYTRKTIKLY